MQLLWSLMALFTGGAVGFAFGRIQEAAQRRNEKRQRDGQLTSGWGVMPGSGARVAYLLLALVLIQIVCPMIFKNGIQWWVSAGVAAGYGYTLYMQLRQKMSGKK